SQPGRPVPRSVPIRRGDRRAAGGAPGAVRAVHRQRAGRAAGSARRARRADRRRCRTAARRARARPGQPVRAVLRLPQRRCHAALAEAGFPALAADLTRLRAEGPELVAALRREALLRGAGIVLGPADGEFRLETLAHEAIPVIAYGTGGWDPSWSATPPLQLDA